MGTMSNLDKVSNMYVEKDTLSIRIEFHNKYSENSYGFGNWIFDQYDIKNGSKILEIGCGTGGTWSGVNKKIPKDVSIILTDFSPLMVENSRKLLGSNSAFSFQQMDIQNIPFENETFDIVIANHMLYHVPDMDKGLSEVYRVLKNSGVFYASTIGENTMCELQEIYSEFSHKGEFSYQDKLSFTLENGKTILEKYFKRIESKRYVDALNVTVMEDLLEYILSYNEIPNENIGDFKDLLQSKFDNGSFHISKEQGIFICKK